jgi:AcrR family transcriptional regulator
MPVIPRQTASALRRRTILAAALACFAEKGVQATTLEEIRVRAGVSIGSIYYHFADKQQLAHSAYVEGLESYYQAVLRDLAQHQDAQAGLEGLVRSTLERLAEPSSWLHLAFPAHELHLGAAAAVVVANLEREFAADLAGWLAPHIAIGTLAPLPVAFYLVLLFGPCDRVAEAWRAGRREPGLAEAQQVLASAAWAALRRPTPCRTSAIPQCECGAPDEGVVPRTALRVNAISPSGRGPRRHRSDLKEAPWRTRWLRVRRRSRKTLSMRQRSQSLTATGCSCAA